MMLDTSLEEIEQAVINSRAEEISTLTEKALAIGVEPIDIIEKALVPGMQIVGEKI